jgi:hypothetical protein
LRVGILEQVSDKLNGNLKKWIVEHDDYGVPKITKIGVLRSVRPNLKKCGFGCPTRLNWLKICFKREIAGDCSSAISRRVEPGEGGGLISVRRFYR